MKILIAIHQSLPRWLGGAEVYAQLLAQALVRRGQAVTIFTREEAGDGLQRAELGGVSIYRCLTPAMGDAGKFRAAFGHGRVERAFDQVLSDVKPDVVNFHHLLGLSPKLFWRAAALGLPTVLTLQDYWYVCANTKLLTNYDGTLCGGPRLWLNCARCGAAKLGPAAAVMSPVLAPAFALRDLGLRRVLHAADRLIAPSQFLGDTYLRLGAPPERMMVMEGGIDPPPVPPEPIARSGPLRVLFMGSPRPLKGLHVLIEAFNGLPPDAELAIGGDLQREPAYAAKLRSLARHPGIRWLGPVGREDIWQWFNWADVVAVPSLWYENAPLTIQEALAMRRPVIASRLGALPEWVRDEVDGALFPPGDAAALAALLQRLATDRAVLLRWQANIRPVRTAADLAADMEQLYGDLLARRGAGRGQPRC